MQLSKREQQELVLALRRILDHYGVDYRQSPESFEVAASWEQHYGYRPSPMTLQKALFAAEHSRQFSPPWYRRIVNAIKW